MGACILNTIIYIYSSRPLTRSSTREAHAQSRRRLSSSQFSSATLHLHLYLYQCKRLQQSSQLRGRKKCHNTGATATEARRSPNRAAWHMPHTTRQTRPTLRTALQIFHLLLLVLLVHLLLYLDQHCCFVYLLLRHLHHHHQPRFRRSRPLEQRK